MFDASDSCENVVAHKTALISFVAGDALVVKHIAEDQGNTKSKIS